MTHGCFVVLDASGGSIWQLTNAFTRTEEDDRAMTSLTKNKSIENTIEPDYDGHDVDDLLKEKRADIEKLKDLLGADMPEPDAKVFPYYDDIFYLRYILSFSTAEDSVEPIKAAIEYRHNNPKFADMLKKVEEETWEFEPIVETSLKYQVAGLSDAKLDHGPLVIIRPGKAILRFSSMPLHLKK